uniref:CHHC U11-48K-type domain-containing protein n=1 Tax=Cacopsylla melanoneura TaxID=428564 RepID=A0A8D8YSL7_9HEMI
MGSLDWLRPNEYNEAPGECIVGAYWVPNEACEPNRIMVTCPFDPNHKMKQSKLAGHIVKCEKNFPDIKKVPCIYNALEFIDRDKVEEHHLVCSHKSDFVQSNPYQIPIVDHSLVQSHLTTWEDDGKVKDVPESTYPDEDTDSFAVNEAFPKSLRNFVGLENNTEALLDQGPIKSEETGVCLEQDGSNDTEQDGSDSDEDESNSVYSEEGGNDAWSVSSVVGDVPLLESFNAYRAVYSDDEEEVYVGESDDESSVHSNSMNPSELSEEQNYSNTAWVASSNEDNNFYSSVDFSKTGDPVDNITIYRINHAEELFKGSDRLKAKVANFCELNIDNSDAGASNSDAGARNSDNMSRDETNDICGNDNHNNEHIGNTFEQSYDEVDTIDEVDAIDEVDTIDGELNGVNNVQEQGCNNTHEHNSSINSGDSQIRPLSVLKIIDYTHDAPEQYRAKPRKPLTLSDLAVFPDEPEPCPYFVSKHNGLQTFKVEDESQVFWKNATGNYQGNSSYTGDYETSSQSSDSSVFLQRDQLLQSLAKGRVDHSAYDNTKQGHNRRITAGRGLLVSPKNSSAHQDAFHSGGGRGDSHNTQFRNLNASCSAQASQHNRPGFRPNMSVPKNNPSLNSRGSFNPQMGRGQDFSDTNQRHVSKPGGNLDMNFPQRNGRVTPNSNFSKSSYPASKSFGSSPSQGFNRHQGNQSASDRNESPSSAQMGRGQDIPRNIRHFPDNYHSRSPRSYESNIHSSNQFRNENVNQGDFKSQGKGRGQLLKSLIQSRTLPQPGQIHNQNHHQVQNYQHRNHNQGQSSQQKNHRQDQNYQQQNKGQNYQQQNHNDGHHQGRSENDSSPVVTHTPRGVTQSSPKRGLGRGALLQYILEKNKASP